MKNRSRPFSSTWTRKAEIRKDESRVLDFSSHTDWRRWLEQNHDRSDGEWVYMYKKDARKQGLRYPDALDQALCFGWIDGQVRAVDHVRFKQRWTPRRPGSIWSQVNRGHVLRLIREGRMAGPGLAAVGAAKRSGAWRNAYSNTGPTRVPQDLGRALAADSRALANFRRFAPSYRRAYIGWVVGARQSTTRERRIAAVVRRARENRKPGMDSPYS